MLTAFGLDSRHFDYFCARVVKLTTFVRESSEIDDFWTRESSNLRLLDARVMKLATFGTNPVNGPPYYPLTRNLNLWPFCH